MQRGRTIRFMSGALTVVGAVLLFISCSSALPPMNTTKDGLAVKGYDVVAYFTEGRPVQGLPEFEHEWNGAKWRFSSSENLELFTSEPEKYAPQYGGY